MFLVAEEDLRRATSSVAALGAKISLGYGSLQFFDTSNVQVQIVPGKGPIFLNAPEGGETKPLPYLIITIPMPGGADNPDQDEARRQENAVVALVVAFVGRNAVARRLFDMTYDIDAEAFGLMGVIDNPLRHGKPNLTDDALLEVEGASRALGALSTTSRQRVLLSLRWFGESLEEDVDEDAFIKLWVALEVLAMPDQTNVRPLNELLAAAYGIPFADAAARFQAGRIQGLRGDMLHAGVTAHHFPLINSYTQALYIDALRHMLGLQHVGAAEAILEEEGSGIWDRLTELRRRL